MQAVTHRWNSTRTGAALLAALMATLLAGAAPALAQNAPPPKPPKPDTFCATFGPGFVRAPGGSTCVKVSAGVQTDLYSSSVSSSSSASPAPK